LIIPAAYIVVGRSVEAVFAREPSSGLEKGNNRHSFSVLEVATMVGLGLLATTQVAAVILMGRFVATHDTPGGFDKPLAHYQSIADQAIAVARETRATELLVVGEGDSVVVDQTPAIFDVLLRDQIAYRFVRGESAAVFPPHTAVALISPEAGKAAAWYRPWPGQDLENGYRLVTVDGSWPQDSFEVVSGPRTFQNGLEIQGYYWNDTYLEENKYALWLQWQTLWQGTEDTHFYVHFLDKNRVQWGQRDAVGYPTTLRRKGDRIISLFDIIPPESEPSEPYWARVGLYTYPEIIDVPVIDQAGNPITGTIILGPLGREP
jgi:hypothetical protein